MCVMCPTNHELREARGGTKTALRPPTSLAIDLTSGTFSLRILRSQLDLTELIYIGNPFINEILEKNGTPEVLKSKQDHLAAIPFENDTFTFTDSATGCDIATPPWNHSLGYV